MTKEVEVCALKFTTHINIVAVLDAFLFQLKLWDELKGANLNSTLNKKKSTTHFLQKFYFFVDIPFSL